MSLAPSYLETLSRLPKTRPLREFAAGEQGVFLRHDVDHDLDIALEMAFWEREAGHRATYFILPTAPYAADARLLAKLKQIEAFGHEVGVHLDFIGAWARGDDTPLAEAAAALLRDWRGAGLEVSGCAAHGDRTCYEVGFINYWMFRELRPQDPARESGLSPEGVPDPDPARRIAYPASDAVRRADGAELPLWTVSMEALGLRYHATHLPMDAYYSDSGGTWRRTASPLEADLGTGSHQVLMHPEYYRGKPRRIFVVSTARSGSKWLATVAAAASSAHAVHEFSLNHRYDGDGRLVAEKRTHAGFAGLQRDVVEPRELLQQTLRYAGGLQPARDFLECNVYLAHFLPLLRIVFPDCRIAHLHRHPAAVVRSLLNRGWYDTPKDDRHPQFDNPEWARAGQFERACFYVANTTAQIGEHAEAGAALESLSADAGALEGFFRSLGVAFYPVLAAEVFGERVNASAHAGVPPYEDWPAERKAVFAAICGPAARALGYEVPEAPPARHRQAASYKPRFSRLERRAATLFDAARGGRTAASPSVAAERAGAGYELTVAAGKNGYFLLGGGTWRRITPLLHGWRARRDAYYTLDCRAAGTVGEIGVFALLYDWRGRLLEARRFSRLSPSLAACSGAFSVAEPQQRWLNIALYFPADATQARRWRVEQLALTALSLAEYRAA